MSLKKKKLKEKLVNKYRLVILNEDSFEEKISFKLSRLIVFVYGSIFSILLITGTIFLIAFTPLREYIPGYSSTQLKRKATSLVYKVDSLENQLLINESYLKNIKEVLVGKVKDVTFNKDSIADVIKNDKGNINLYASKKDSLFRLQVEQDDKFSLFQEAKKESDIVFFAPLKGNITQDYGVSEKHFAIDIATVEGSPVKSVADGTVIFSEWTASTGHVIIIEHIKGFISIYKHNKTVHKEQGDIVKSGEVIASCGSSGELSTGPHLHFELWHDGYSVNPTNFIDFE